MIKISEKYLRPLDYLFLYRPTLFFPIWIMTMSGLSAGHFFNGNPVWWQFMVNWNNVLVLFLITLASGATFILNQLQTAQTPESEGVRILVSENGITAETAKKIAIISIVVSLAILVFIDLTIFLFVGIIVLIWGYMFNYLPFHWKDKLPLSLIGYLIGGLLLFFSGWTLSGCRLLTAWQAAIPYMAAWLAVIILTLIDHTDTDQKVTGKQPQNRTTVLISFILLLLCFGISLYNQDPIISLPALLSIPLFIVMVFNPTKSWITRSIRYPILFLGLMLGCEFPLFFIILFGSYHLCKIYYFSRFNLIYPTFQIGEDELL